MIVTYLIYDDDNVRIKRFTFSVNYPTLMLSVTSYDAPFFLPST